MELHARLVHAEAGLRVVEVRASRGEHSLGSALAEAATAQEAEDLAMSRLLRRLKDPELTPTAKGAPARPAAGLPTSRATPSRPDPAPAGASGAGDNGGAAASQPLPVARPRRAETATGEGRSVQPENGTQPTAQAELALPAPMAAQAPGEPGQEPAAMARAAERSAPAEAAADPGPAESSGKPQAAAAAQLRRPSGERQAEAAARPEPAEAAPAAPHNDPQEEPPADPEDWSQELTAVDLQLRRLGWSREQEGTYLQRAFSHPSRSRLTRYNDLRAYLMALEGLEVGSDPALAPVPLRRSELLAQGDALLRQLGWTAEKGRAFLERHLERISRQQLSDVQLLQFNMLLEGELLAGDAPAAMANPDGAQR